MLRTRALLMLATFLCLACDKEPTKTLLPNSGGVSFAASKVDTHSRANLVWNDSLQVNGLTVGAGIRGDGRNRTGQNAGVLNEYQGNFCGVEAYIYDQKGEDGSLNPDLDVRYDPSTMSGPCGPARQMAFFAGDASSIGGSATWAGPHILIGAIWTLAAGESRIQAITYGTQQVLCRVQFDAQYAGADNARLTRLPDVQTTNGSGQTVTARQWRAESQGGHRAACLRLQPNGKYTDSGIRYFLPFSVLITQVPFPYPLYP